MNSTDRLGIPYVKCVLLAVLLAPWVGCSYQPARLKPPKLNPGNVATGAIAQYDANGDEMLSDQELQDCPGMLQNKALYDTDQDGSISAAEIVARFEYLTSFKTALTPLRSRVTLKGKALDGAQIKLIPEDYFDGSIKTAVGVTDRGGSASISIPKEDLPAAQQNYTGIHYGTYQVEITHPQMQLPAKYNTATTLGYETKVGDPLVTFSL